VEIDVRELLNRQIEDVLLVEVIDLVVELSPSLAGWRGVGDVRLNRENAGCQT
jgi:hypothetical protein